SKFRVLKRILPLRFGVAITK
ncbi:glycosyl hydrolases family 2, TIM barrel domain protein, partial [Vibrio parahaemolyticus V-223/04]